jgi:hypothetical protein
MVLDRVVDEIFAANVAQKTHAADSVHSATAGGELKIF